MITLPQKVFYVLGCALILVCVFFSLLAATPVRADVGVRPVLPGGSSVQPGEETPIQMAAEVVTMTMRQATEADNALVALNPDSYGFNIKPVWYEAVSEVDADFTMRNPTSDEVNLTTWFPLASALQNNDWNFNPGEIVPYLESFQVSVNGNLLDVEVTELPNPKGTDKPLLPWASFLVTFPPGEDTIIHVNYMVPLTPSAKGYEVALYYIFQTGAGWARPIGQAELILNLPYPASAETMADISKLSLPYGSFGQVSTGVPAGAILQGNQARWTWKNFEPGPEDDFAIWLIKPGKWQELQTARAAVKADPQDGHAWLELAFIYHTLSTHRWTNPRVLFSPVYFPQAIEAYQKAAVLLPEHPAPHIGLGLLTLASYSPDIKSAPSNVIQYVEDELEIARTLETRNPSLAGEAGLSTSNLEEALSAYYYNDATATVDAATQQVWISSLTAQATQNYATLTLWANAEGTFWACRETPGAECNINAILTTTPAPEITQTRTPLPTQAAEESVTSGQNTAILIAIGMIGLVVLGYLVVKRVRKHTEKVKPK